jgi:hypothetical protein
VPLALHAREWLSVGVTGPSIEYNTRGLPAFAVAPHEWWDAAYVVVVLTPLVIASPGRRFTVFWVTLAGSVAVSYAVFRHTFVSVWCFFAAVLSSQLCYVFAGLGERSGESGEAPRARGPTA